EERRAAGPGAFGLRRAAGVGARRLDRGLRRDGGPRGGRAGSAPRPRERPVCRDHGEGARRPPGRGARRVAAPARAPRVGLRQGRGDRGGRADPREVPRHPARPDHTEKRLLFDLLGGEQKLAIQLTESLAMLPAASVCGFYFSHPEARYFSLGKIGKDQVQDYHRRKGMDIATVERWLSPNLGYDPAAA